MPHRTIHPRPPDWHTFRQAAPRALTPLLYSEWLCANAAHYLSRWSLLAVLEYLGSLSILIAVIFWFSETGERAQQRHYQAWQVINTAQGKGGNGGRIDALEQLNADHISLTGVDLSDAFLQSIQLPSAQLARANLASADARDADLHNANLEAANLNSTNLRNANLSSANLADANLEDADLTGADLRNLKNWRSIRSLKDADLTDIKNPPPGFLEWAAKQFPASASPPATQQQHATAPNH
jgi:hypothetical protein